MRWFPLRNRRRGSSDDRGVTTVEYGILIAGVGILAVGALLFLRDSSSSTFQSTTASTGVCVGAGCNAYTTLPAAALPATGTLALAGYYSISASVGVAIAPQLPSPSGGTAPYTYGIAPSPPSGMTFNAGTGELSGAPTATQGAVSYTVTVTDSLGSTATQTLSITVTSVPALSLSGYSSITAITGTAIASQSPSPSGGTPSYSYSISPAVPSGLNFDTGTGVLSGTPTATQSAANYTITVTDSALVTASQTISIAVAEPLSLTGYSNITGTTGTAITTQTPTPSGGTTPYSYAISPSAPAGLSFASGTGALSGTPTTYQASTTYTITLTDGAGRTATQTISIALTNPTCGPTQILVNGSCAATPPITLCYQVRRGSLETYPAFNGYTYASGSYSAELTSVQTPGTLTTDKQGFTWTSPNNASGTRSFTVAFTVTYAFNGATATGTGAGSVSVTYDNGVTFPTDPEVITCP